MAGRRGGALESLRRTLPLVLLVLGLATTTWGVSGPLAVAAASAARAPFVPTHSGAPAPAAPGPSAEANATFTPQYGSTPIAPPPPNSTPCQSTAYGPTFLVKECAAETQNPTLVPLANGDLGLGYSEYTTNGSLCNSSTNSTLGSWTVSNVAWASSASNGSTWSAPTFLGTPSCRWPSASEPTFAAGPGDDVFGAYIVSNASVNATSFGTPQPFYPPDWNSSKAATGALVFVHSANNGSTWSAPTVVSGATAPVEPRMAVSGRTIYVVYVNTNNSSAIYPAGTGLNYSNYPALSVSLVVSTNAGASWSAPIVLPGLNASMGYWSSSPSVAVSANRTVGVAYATDRSCVLNCRGGFYTYPVFADEIVVATSANNGSTWTGPTVAGGWMGESYLSTYYSDAYSPNGYAFPWLSTPQTSIAYPAGGSGIYIAYAGTYQSVSSSSSYSYLNWQRSGVFASYSSNGGTSWTNATVAANLSLGNVDDEFAPAITVHSKVAYVAYMEMNGTYCYSLSGNCPGFVGSSTSWIANSTNFGANWSSTLAGFSYYGTPTYTALDYLGYESSVAITSGGVPVTATTLASFATQSSSAGGPPYVLLQEYWTNISVGYPYTGPTTTVDFVEHNLSAGQTWGVQVGTQTLTTNLSSIRVSGVPEGIALPLAVLAKSVSAYATTFTESLSVVSPYEFHGPITIDVNYTTEYGLTLFIEPTLSNLPGYETEMIGMFFGGQYYYIEAFDGYVYHTPYPWMFPAGVELVFQLTGDPPFSYWNGTGIGSITGASSTLNLTLGSPVNETGWAGSYGVYTEEFSANDLPSTSVYNFTFNGTRYSTPALDWTNVSGVQTGGYSVSDITANASTSGWEYFGGPATGSSTVVVPAEPTVAFNFALVDLAAPSGNITFVNAGLVTGTVWSVDFNGTDYSSSAATLNVSTRPGTFPWSIGPAIAADESTGYAPAKVNATISVTVGQTVDVSYVPAYDVHVLSGLGGAVSAPGPHWVAAGTNATYVAQPGSDYGFVGWTGSGLGSYTGTNLTANLTANGPITESATFYPLPDARFAMTFEETGVPAGTSWTVFVNGVGYSSNSTSLSVPDLLSCAAGSPGQYAEAVGIAFNASLGTVRYLPSNAPTGFCTNGGTVQPLAFVPQYELRVSATLGGSASLADGNVVSSTSLWAYATDTVLLDSSVATGYTFAGWSGTGVGSYSGAKGSTDLAPGGPITELATFAPIPPPSHPTYTVEFESTPTLPVGATWSLTIDGATYAAVGADLNVSGLGPQPYTATVGTATSSAGTARWAPTPATISIDVTANGEQSVTFGTPQFWVSISGSAGGSVTPASGWFAGGTSVPLGATANTGWLFVNWTGTGTGSYSGNQSSASVSVKGPFSEFATFRPPATSTTTTASSVWSNPGTWAILAVVGLLAGLVVGVAVRRLGRSPPSDGSSGGSA